MPTRAGVVGNTEVTGVTIPAEPQRTVLVVQNLDTVAGTDWLYMSDEKGRVAVSGVRIAPLGGSLTLRRTHGEEPEKSWYLVAATAACPVRYMILYGEATVIVKEKLPEPEPQEPEQPSDAPKMKPEKHVPTGYL